MMNTARGEVELCIDGTAHCLCLTLGAMAEIETIEAENGVGRLTAQSTILVLMALLRGGGNPVSRETLLQARLDPEEVAHAIGRALAP